MFEPIKKKFEDFKSQLEDLVQKGEINLSQKEVILQDITKSLLDEARRRLALRKIRDAILYLGLPAISGITLLIVYSRLLKRRVYEF